MELGLIQALIDNGIKIGIVVIAGGLVGLVQVGMQITIAINSKFEHAETVMRSEVDAIRTRQLATNAGITQIAFALMRGADSELKKMLMEATEKLQGGDK